MGLFSKVETGHGGSNSLLVLLLAIVTVATRDSSESKVTPATKEQAVRSRSRYLIYRDLKGYSSNRVNRFQAI